MSTSDRFPFGAAVYLVNRYNFGAWPTIYSLPEKINEKDISKAVTEIVMADYTARVPLNRAGAGGKEMKPFLTSEDVDAIVALIMDETIVMKDAILDHPRMSETTALRFIDFIVTSNSIVPDDHGLLLSGFHGKDDVSDKVIAAIYTHYPQTSLLLVRPNAGPATTAAWLANPNRHQHLTAEEIIRLLNQNGIPEEDYLALCNSLEQCDSEQITRAYKFRDNTLAPYINNILNPDFRHAHLISDSLRSRIIVSLTIG